MRAITLLLLAAVSALTTGCAATQVALENKDLDVQLQASQTIFLRPVAGAKKTVWIDVKNTSGTDLDLAALPGLLSARGYRVVQDPDSVTYWLQVNVLYVGKASVSAIRDSVYAGWGGAMAGGVAGATAGWASESAKGVLIGSGVGTVLGGAAELIAGSLVKKVTYTAIADVQVSERAPEGSASPVPPPAVAQGTITQVTSAPQPGQVGLPPSQTTVVSAAPQALPGWQAHRTRMAAIATKVNLDFSEARPALLDRLLRSVAGVL